MTGYAYREFQTEKASFSIEIKSYNNRYLDLFFNIPNLLSPLEPFFRQQISEKCKRGRIELNVKYRVLQDGLDLHLDESGVKKYAQVLERIRELAQIKEPISVANFQSISGLIESRNRVELDEVQALLAPVLDELLSEFIAARQLEGAQTQRDILEKIETIEDMVNLTALSASTIEEKIKENLIARYKELVGESVDMQRVYAEIAVYLVKATINEELERLSSHITTFRQMAITQDLVGKKLDFLAQEMNREINTIGSKNILTEIAAHVVNAKDALEQIREQLRNVE